MKNPQVTSCLMIKKNISQIMGTKEEWFLTISIKTL